MKNRTGPVWRVIARVAGVAVVMAGVSGAATDASYDLVFSGGRVADGSGTPMVTADVGIKGDRIAAVGDLSQAGAKRRIDARRLVISPGFIDMLGWSEYNVLVDNRAASKITQGITTEITGEGHSIAPQNATMIAADREVFEYYGVTPNWTTLAGYFAELTKKRSAINIGTFVGAGGVREYVMGRDNRPPTRAEMAQMEAQVAQAMEEGAFGVSTSLLYVPDRFATTDEIIALARVARRYGGTYITHQRDEGNRIATSLEEVFRIARAAGIPAEIWHLKTAGRQNWGRMAEVLKRIEKARAEGLEITANMYPWIASSNSLHASLPAWARAGTTAEMIARLKDPKQRTSRTWWPLTRRPSSTDQRTRIRGLTAPGFDTSPSTVSWSSTAAPSPPRAPDASSAARGGRAASRTDLARAVDGPPAPAIVSAGS